MVKITKETNLADAIAKHPEIIPVFLKYGLHCIGCHASTYETIEQGALGHGMSEDKVNAIVKESNKIIEDEHTEKKKRDARVKTKKKNVDHFAK